jgi:hypothetical protein
MGTAAALKTIKAEATLEAAKWFISCVDESLNHRGKMVKRNFFWDYQITDLRHPKQAQSWSFIVNDEHLNFYFRTTESKEAAPMHKLKKVFARPQNKVHQNSEGEHIVRITDLADAEAMVSLLKLKSGAW